jgi:quercetin dioxygenase-like cupin family protein
MPASNSLADGIDASFSDAHSNRESEIMIKQFLCAVALIATAAITASAHDARDEAAKVTLVYDHVLPNVPGKSIRGVLVEYVPGGSSPGHVHPKSAFIYATVLQGAIRSQVNDGPVTTYHAGESFSEFPGDRHRVSENASATEPARLLAVFVVDTDETVLTSPLTK